LIIIFTVAQMYPNSRWFRTKSNLISSFFPLLNINVTSKKDR